MENSATLVRREKYNSEWYEFFRQNEVSQTDKEESAMAFSLQVIQEFCLQKRTKHPTTATIVYLFREISSNGVDYTLVQLILPEDQVLRIVPSSTTITPVYWTRSRGWVTGVFLVLKELMEDFPKEYITRISGDNCLELLRSVLLDPGRALS